MNLPDRRRSERLVVELGEEPLDRLSEILADRPLDVAVGERAHVVLQAAELGDDVRRHDVRTRREQLAELDERRAELVEHLAQVPAACRPLDAGSTRPAAVDRVAEPVADRDLRDLAQPAEVPLLGALPRRKCCTRPTGLSGCA